MAAAPLVLASANPKKVAELAEILTSQSLGFDLVSRPDDVPEVVEDAPDFVGNARLKAAALVAATGWAALADDSGLEVDALDGAPGVHSARYAGEDATDAANVALLLRSLAELEAEGAESDADPIAAAAAAAAGPDDAAVPARARSARFRCVIVLQRPDGTEVVADGAVEGTIIETPRGDAGFGYDPVFVPNEGDGRTFAEMTAAEKHEISHRGRALRALAAQLTP